MAQPRFPTRAFLIEVMRAVHIRLAAGRRVVLSDIRVCLVTLPGLIRVVIGDEERLRHHRNVGLQLRHRELLAVHARHLTVQHLQFGLIDVVIDIIAEYRHVAELTLDGVGVDAGLLHEHADVLPVRYSVLETEIMLWILATQPEIELMTEKSTRPHYRLDDFGVAFALEDARGWSVIHAAKVRNDRYLVAAEVVSCLELAEVQDVAAVIARRAPIAV